MALRDWHGWQIGVFWGIGIAIMWLVGRIGATTVRGQAVDGGGAITSTSTPIWTTGVVLLILGVLIMVTVRWVRSRILDD